MSKNKMEVIIMGAGIVGVATAYSLAKDGHKITVIDKNLSSAMGCSYSNGSQLSFSQVEPLASKKFLPTFFSALFSANSFLSFKKIDKEFIKWAFEFFKNCSLKNTLRNATELHKLAIRSKKILDEIIKEENIKFDYSNNGILHFYTCEKTMKMALQKAEFLKNLGVNVEILNKEECVKKEPTLTKLLDEEKLIGGIYYKDDASGNCLLLVKALEKICKEKFKVNFIYDAEIKNILNDRKKITGIHSSQGVFTADNYVFALGAYSLNILKGIGVETGIYPVKGYSISTIANKKYLAPKIALSDDKNKIVYSRIDDVFRVAGGFEISDLKSKKDQKLINFLKNKMQSSFSDYGNIAEMTDWQGFRPCRPNSIPLICKSDKYSNLFLNAGHGMLGFTLACGSADVIMSSLKATSKN